MEVATPRLVSRLSVAVRLAGIALLLAGAATCYFGPEHEIAQIPKEVRAKMSDTDWIGSEWIGLGIDLQAIGIGCLVLSWVIGRLLRQARNVPTEQQ